MKALALLVIVCLVAVGIGGDGADAAYTPSLPSLWAWFEDQLVPMSCLTQPRMAVTSYRPSGAEGAYIAGTVMVWVGSLVFVNVAVHEFAHHYFEVCHIKDRPIGRRFLRAVNHFMWDQGAKEHFASTLAWVLTGTGRQWPAVPSAAWVFTPKLAP